jgi:hypothetical protein
MSQVVPLVAVPSQTLSITLGRQAVRVTVSQKALGVFVDIYLNDVLVVGGVQARNLVKIIREHYRGFVGDLYFFDTQGTNDPAYQELGARYILLYDPTL